MWVAPSQLPPFPAGLGRGPGGKGVVLEAPGGLLRGGVHGPTEGRNKDATGTQRTLLLLQKHPEPTWRWGKRRAEEGCWHGSLWHCRWTVGIPRKDGPVVPKAPQQMIMELDISELDHLQQGRVGVKRGSALSPTRQPGPQAGTLGLKPGTLEPESNFAT